MAIGLPRQPSHYCSGREVIFGLELKDFSLKGPPHLRFATDLRSSQELKYSSSVGYFVGAS